LKDGKEGLKVPGWARCRSRAVLALSSVDLNVRADTERSPPGEPRATATATALWLTERAAKGASGNGASERRCEAGSAGLWRKKSYLALSADDAAPSPRDCEGPRGRCWEDCCGSLQRRHLVSASSLRAEHSAHFHVESMLLYCDIGAGSV